MLEQDKLQDRKVSQLLQNYFGNQQISTKSIRLQTYSRKEIIYNKSDSLKYVYYIIEGSLRLKIYGKQFQFDKNVILGDYQQNHQYSRRISTLKAIKRTRIALIPYQQFQKMNIDPQFTVLESLDFKEPLLIYMMQKLVLKNILQYNNTLYLKNGLAIIISGIFKVLKNINVGRIEETSIGLGRVYSVMKKCGVGEIGSREVVRQNITCCSNYGKVFYLDNKSCDVLGSHFSDFEKLLKQSLHRVELHKEMSKSIQKIYKQSPQIRQVILPNGQNIRKIYTEGELPTIKKFPTLRNIDNRQKIVWKPSQRYSNTSEELIKNSQIIPQDLKIIPFYWQRQFVRQARRLKNNSIDSIKNTQQKQSFYRVPQNIFKTKFHKKMFFKSRNHFQGGFKNINVQINPESQRDSSTNKKTLRIVL